MKKGRKETKRQLKRNPEKEAKKEAKKETKKEAKKEARIYKLLKDHSMNRINRLFHEKSGNILSIYFTAGFPVLDSTVPIIQVLAHAGADMIEIGIPFSDPMADGPVIQQSSDKALKNGMSLSLLFRQLKDIRRDVDIPLLLMGYLNPVMQYGMERFCEHCSVAGIDGVILPDMPLEVFADESHVLLSRRSGERKDSTGEAMDTEQPLLSLQELFRKHDLHNIFLISPQTSTERIRKLDNLSHGFVYLVSASSTTGVRDRFSPEQMAYFRRIREMNLSRPRMIGFGISDRDTFMKACEFAQGAIIGSAFVKMLSNAGDLKKNIEQFINNIR